MRLRGTDAERVEKDRERSPIWRSPFFWAALAGLVLIPLSRPLLRFEPAPPPIVAQLPTLHLVDQNGAPFTVPAAGGEVLVLGLFFTRCTTLCPQLGDDLRALARRYAEAGIDGVTVAAVSVDPLHDGTPELEAWAHRHGADGRRWRLLTGEPQEIRTLAEALGLELGAPVPLPGDPPGRIDIAHPDRLALIDGKGRLRGLYRSDERGLDEVFHRAQHVLKEQRAFGALGVAGGFAPWQ